MAQQMSKQTNKQTNKQAKNYSMQEVHVMDLMLVFIEKIRISGGIGYWYISKVKLLIYQNFKSHIGALTTHRV